MKGKIFWLTAIFTFLVIVFGGLPFLFAKGQIFDFGAKIAFEKNNYIWVFDLKTKTKIKLGPGNFPAVSNKIDSNSGQAGQNEVAYVLTMNNPHFEAKKHKSGIYLYNFSNGKTRYLNSSPDALGSPLMFSPNNKYLLGGVHLSTYDKKIVIDKKSGKKLVSFITLGNDFRWLDDKTIVFTSFHNVSPLRPRLEGGGLGFGISKINVLSGKSQILKKPTSKVEYRLWGLSGGKIQFVKYSVKSPSDWANPTRNNKRYFEMVKSGKKVKKIKRLISWSQKIRTVLPPKYLTYQIIDKGGWWQDKNWRLLILNQTYDVNNEEIYIFHYPDVSTLEKIANGHNPSWGGSLD